MSKKKPNTKENKITKKHNFSHLTRTKSAARTVEAEATTNDDRSVSPLNSEIGKDLKKTLILISVFVIAILLLWILFGRNNELIEFYDKIKIL